MGLAVALRALVGTRLFCGKCHSENPGCALRILKLKIVLSSEFGGLAMTHFATVWTILLLVTGYPRAITVATYDTEEACKEAITKMIAHPQKELKLECHEDIKL
jgi:hypothetical protein